ncbi:hypothetical protein FOCC_FOCC012915 [Frankliniella occidentalis]|nr:hypothetical protein FOCC_FOCC012915 [Frankliniella occidentalis]
MDSSRADADRYAGGYNDAYVANAWERAVDGWVRGGYTLVSGDVHTDVRYVVDPSGEMRVMARRPGATVPAAAQQAADASRVSSATTTTTVHHQLGRPLLGGYRPPFYQRLIRLGSLHDVDDEPFDDVDLDLDDDPVDDDDPFFFDVVPDNWNDARPVDEWVRLVQDGGMRRGPDVAHGRRYFIPPQAPSGPEAPPTYPPSSTPAAEAEAITTAGPVEDAVGAASFQSGHYNVVLRTSKA